MCCVWESKGQVVKTGKSTLRGGRRVSKVRKGQGDLSKHLLGTGMLGVLQIPEAQHLVGAPRAGDGADGGRGRADVAVPVAGAFLLAARHRRCRGAQLHTYCSSSSPFPLSTSAHMMRIAPTPGRCAGFCDLLSCHHCHVPKDLLMLMQCCRNAGSECAGGHSMGATLRTSTLNQRGIFIYSTQHAKRLTICCCAGAAGQAGAGQQPRRAEERGRRAGGDRAQHDVAADARVHGAGIHGAPAGVRVREGRLPAGSRSPLHQH